VKLQEGDMPKAIVAGVLILLSLVYLVVAIRKRSASSEPASPPATAAAQPSASKRSESSTGAQSSAAGSSANTTAAAPASSSAVGPPSSALKPGTKLVIRVVDPFARTAVAKAASTGAPKLAVHAGGSGSHGGVRPGDLGLLSSLMESKPNGTAGAPNPPAKPVLPSFLTISPRNGSGGPRSAGSRSSDQAGTARPSSAPRLPDAGNSLVASSQGSQVQQAESANKPAPTVACTIEGTSKTAILRASDGHSVLVKPGDSVDGYMVAAIRTGEVVLRRSDGDLRILAVGAKPNGS